MQTHPLPIRRYPVWSLALGIAKRTLDLLVRWQARAEQRHRLELMSDWELRDMGLTRAQAESEARRLFWQP